MAILGITSLDHDASVALIDEEEILFAAHAERYSGIKNDGVINEALIADARRYGDIESIVWYERPHKRFQRYIKARQWQGFNRPPVRDHLLNMGLQGLPVAFVGHHESHAAGGFFTSPFDTAAIVVIDAIGEMDTISVWKGSPSGLKKIWTTSYPHSLGLLYSAFTQRIGLKPNEEEYILMGMAAYGEPLHVNDIEEEFLKTQDHKFILKKNVHRGIKEWRRDIQNDADIAASIQKVTERYLCRFMRWVRQVTGEKNLVYMGGVALNCVANSLIHNIFENVWIMPNPGDAGSAIGAVAAHTKKKLNWTGPYLGHDINRSFDYDGAISALKNGEVIGVANGRAEFGPRALGNRSLLADPRGDDVKDRVNRIKKRELFRPFAPIVLAEHAFDHFHGPTSDYMQFVSYVRRPDLFPAITHHDGTARVQALSETDKTVSYRLLKRWYEETGCPMLVNTSLNIKGKPLVNDWDDAIEFQKIHGIRIF